MVLTKKSSVDDTLAIVKDVGKFKARIAELGKATKAFEKANEEHVAKNKMLFAELDAKTEAANAELKAATSRAKELDAAAGTEMDAVNTRKAEVVKREETFERRVAKLEMDRAQLRRDRAEIVGERVVLTGIAKRFKAAAAAACNGII